MARMTGFVFQDKYLVRLEKLSDQEVGRLVRALATYHATGETQELKGRECGYYDFIKADIDEIEQKYATKCQNMKRTNSEQNTSIAPNCPQLPTIDSNCEQLPINKNKKENIDIITARTREDDTMLGTITVDPLIIKVQQELNGLTDTHYSALDDYRRELGDELVSYAIDISVGNGVRNWNYVESILRGWLTLHIHTVGEAKAESERHKKQQQAPVQRGGKVVSAQQYQQRDYNEDKLADSLGVSDLFKEGAG